MPISDRRERATFICSYSNGNVGLAQELGRYLARRQQNYFILYHPLNVTQERRSQFETFEGGELIYSTRTLGSPPLEPLHYLRCFLTTFWLLGIYGRQVRLFIVFSNVDALAGIFWSWFYKMKVVYVSTDFSPRKRFSNLVLEGIYRLSDRLVYLFGDVVWHMYPERKTLKKIPRRAVCYDVLDGNNFRRIQRLPPESINRFRLAYIGQINRDCRLEEVLVALSVLKGEFPEVGMDLITSGDPVAEQKLKDLAKNLGLDSRVTFHGQIRVPEVYEKILAQCGVGVCLYDIDPNDFAWYGLPLKVFMYGACGLVSLCSDSMGPFAHEVLEDSGIGLFAKRGEVEPILRRLFSDSRFYFSLRERAIAWASQYDYDDKFKKFISLAEGGQPT